MLFGGVIFLLLGLVFVAAVFVAVVLIARGRRGPGSHADPSCGACGYNVRGLSQLSCPECGADLREVGILTPNMRRGIGPIGGVVLWSVIQLLPGMIGASLAIAFLVPNVYTRTENASYAHRKYTGNETNPPTIIQTIDVSSAGKQTLWPWEGRWPNKVPPNNLSIKVFTEQGSAARLDIDLNDTAYRYQDASGAIVEARAKVDEAVLTQWLESTGIMSDTSQPDRQGEIDDLHTIVRNGPLTGIENANLPLFAQQGSGSSSGGHPAPWGVAVVISVWVLVWLAGAVFIYRRLSRRTSTSK